MNLYPSLNETELNNLNTINITINNAFLIIGLESKKIKGLFICGELADVDGDCGGYNLQWAFSSGYVAGINAVRGLK